MSGTPAIVLGGTGYVAGELLRLIAGHPDLKLAGDSLRQPAGHAGLGRLPPFAQCLSGLEVLGPRRRRVAHPASRRGPRCSPRRPHGVSAAIVDRLLTAAEAAGARVHCVDISADFRYSSAAAYESVYKHAHGAPGRIGEFTCARARALAEVADSARRPSRMLLHRHLARQRAPVGTGIDRYPAVRHGHHGQHGSGPQARRGHASSAPAQRSVFLRRPEPSACAGNHRLREARDGRGGGIQLRAAFGPLRPRHSRHGTGQPEEAARHGTGIGGAEILLPGLPLRAGGRFGAARQGCGRQQLCASGRGDQRQFHRRHVPCSTISTRAPPAVPCSG